MNRRKALGGLAALVGASAAGGSGVAHAGDNRFGLTRAQWLTRITPEQYDILFEEGTERAFTSPLNEEKREGHYACAACNQVLFPSEFKYNSGTGWPSFFDAKPEALQTSVDFKLIYPRTEYHCSNCGGHHGHVFKDGPQVTGKRYCNNGLALKFIPEGEPFSEVFKPS